MAGSVFDGYEFPVLRGLAEAQRLSWSIREWVFSAYYAAEPRWSAYCQSDQHEGRHATGQAMGDEIIGKHFNSGFYVLHESEEFLRRAQQQAATAQGDSILEDTMRPAVQLFAGIGQPGAHETAAAMWLQGQQVWMGVRVSRAEYDALLDGSDTLLAVLWGNDSYVVAVRDNRVVAAVRADVFVIAPDWHSDQLWHVTEPAKLARLLPQVNSSRGVTDAPHLSPDEMRRFWDSR